jgi:hypothetical protein
MLPGIVARGRTIGQTEEKSWDLMAAGYFLGNTAFHCDWSAKEERLRWLNFDQKILNNRS